MLWKRGTNTNVCGSQEQGVGKESRAHSGQSKILCKLSRWQVARLPSCRVIWAGNSQMSLIHSIYVDFSTDAPLGIAGKGNVQEQETVTLAVLSGLKTISLMQARNPCWLTSWTPHSFRQDTLERKKNMGLCLCLLSMDDFFSPHNLDRHSTHNPHALVSWVLGYRHAPPHSANLGDFLVYSEGKSESLDNWGDLRVARQSVCTDVQWSLYQRPLVLWLSIPLVSTFLMVQLLHSSSCYGDPRPWNNIMTVILLLLGIMT